MNPVNVLVCESILSGEIVVTSLITRSLEVYMARFSFPCRVFRFLATSTTRCGGERTVIFSFRTLTLTRDFYKKTEIEYGDLFATKDCTRVHSMPVNEQRLKTSTETHFSLGLYSRTTRSKLFFRAAFLLLSAVACPTPPTSCVV